MTNKIFIDTEFLEGTQTERKAMTLNIVGIIGFLLISIGCLMLGFEWHDPILFIAVVFYLSLAAGLIRNHKKSRFQTPPTIDLISIGLVKENGDTYYAISKDFNLMEAWNRWQQRTGEGDRNNWEPKHYWIRENVLQPIWIELFNREYPTPQDYLDVDCHFSYKNLKRLINTYGKTNEQIAKEVKEFCKKDYLYQNADTTTQWKDRGNPYFYGYMCAADYMAMTWLFGGFNNWPDGFPYYFIDLKQELDRKVEEIRVEMDCFTHEEHLTKIKADHNYPKETNSHHALADAKLNLELYKFLQSL